MLTLQMLGLGIHNRDFRLERFAIGEVIGEGRMHLRQSEVPVFGGNLLREQPLQVQACDGPHEDACAGQVRTATLNPWRPDNHAADFNCWLRIHARNMGGSRQGVNSRS